MRDKLGIQDVSKLIFMTEKEYLQHLGEHYEETIHQAKEAMEPVVRIMSINGTYSAIPLDRALQLLEKYHKLSRKPSVKQQDNVISMQTKVEKAKQAEENELLEEQKKMA